MSAAKDNIPGTASMPAVPIVATPINPDEGEQYAEWLALNSQQSVVRLKLRLFNAMVSGDSANPKSWLLAIFLRRWILPLHSGVEQYAGRLAHEAVENWTNLRRESLRKRFV